jgi:hypothetical protein
VDERFMTIFAFAGQREGFAFSKTPCGRISGVIIDTLCFCQEDREYGRERE